MRFSDEDIGNLCYNSGMPDITLIYNFLYIKVYWNKNSIYISCNNNF